jgi:voltage-gated potassium channel
MSAVGDKQRGELFLANLLLLSLLGIGAMGYVLIEKWTWLDAFYMTFLTLTTIGFSEVGQLSSPGRIFTMFLGAAGIGTVAFIATRSAQLILTRRSYRERTLTKMIENTRDHYIVCGYGRIGSKIAEDLSARGVPFVVIENTPMKLEQIVAAEHLYVAGDAEEEETLKAWY